MSKAADYSTIERPYGDLLERDAALAISTGDFTTTSDVQSNPNTSGQADSGGGTGGESGAAASGDTGGGSVQETTVKDTGALEDIWIDKFIRSGSWKPKKSGFYIDGRTGYAEFSNVYVAGEIQALSGAIGGWIINTTSITDIAGLVGLSSAVTGGDDIRFWAGHTTPSSAPFYVTEAGVIKASSGTIGGWTIGATSLTDTAGLVGMSSAVTAGDDYRFWAGHVTPSSAPFSVTEAGVIKASSGTVGGNTLGTTFISSTTFVSGLLGSGWRILNTGVAEFQDVTVRGIIRTSVFEKDTISAVNGIVLISKADVLASDMTALDASTLTITGETTFVANEVIRIKDGTDDEWMLVTNAASAPTYTVTRDLAGNYSANNNPVWKKGTAVVSMGVGAGTNTGFVLLDSSSSDSPFIDVYNRNSTTYTDYSLKARLGWLRGIVDASVGLNSTDVWGLYSDSVYLKGTIVASAGAIGGWTIGATSLTDTAGLVGMSSAVTIGDDIRFFAGHVTPASAPFRVTESGALVASSATITGSVTATSGAIGGFTIGATTMTATNLTLTSGAANTANIAVGTGANLAGLNSANIAGDIAIWAGSTFANRATAPFHVTAAGILTATGALITGTIQTSATAPNIIIDSPNNRIEIFNSSGTSIAVIGGVASNILNITVPSAAGFVPISIQQNAAAKDGIYLDLQAASTGLYVNNNSSLYGIHLKGNSTKTSPLLYLEQDGSGVPLEIDVIGSTRGIKITSVAAVNDLINLNVGDEGSAIVVNLTDSTNSFPGIEINNDGGGRGLYIHNDKTTSTNHGLLIESLGTGYVAEFTADSNASRTKATLSLVATSGQGAHLTMNPIASAPATPSSGDIYYDTDTHWYGWNGSSWKQLDN